MMNEQDFKKCMMLLLVSPIIFIKILCNIGIEFCKLVSDIVPKKKIKYYKVMVVFLMLGISVICFAENPEMIKESIVPYIYTSNQYNIDDQPISGNGVSYWISDNDKEIWRTDGTTDGTYMLYDASSMIVNDTANLKICDHMLVDDIVFVIVSEEKISSKYYMYLIRTDGTDEGTFTIDNSLNTYNNSSSDYYSMLLCKFTINHKLFYYKLPWTLDADLFVYDVSKEKQK